MTRLKQPRSQGPSGSGASVWKISSYQMSPPSGRLDLGDDVAEPLAPLPTGAAHGVGTEGGLAVGLARRVPPHVGATAEAGHVAQTRIAHLGRDLGRDLRV